jgi:peptidoglycan/LPS O-acetylase OafA/YrhL
MHWSYAGAYAVFAFFVLSGYAVCYILKYSYLPKHHGISKYLLNRGLRIFPSYWVVCIFFALLIAFYPDKAGDILSCGFPTGKSLGLELGWWFFILSLLGSAIPFISYALRPVLIPPVSSIGTEIFYWLLMPALLIHPRLRVATVVFAVGYTLFGAGLTLYIGQQPNLFHIQLVRYYSQFAGALPFCLGMLLLLQRARKQVHVPHMAAITAMLLFVILLARAPWLFSDPYFIGAYISLVLNVCIILYLAQFDQKLIPTKILKIDTFLGDLSYPVFLVHFPIATTLHIVFPLIPLHSFSLFGCTLAVSMLAAILLHYVIEVPMSRLRRGVKC